MDYNELENKIVRLYSKCPMVSFIADKLDLHYSIVSFFLKNAGVEIKQGPRKIREAKHIEEMKRLYEEGEMSSLEIAVKYNISLSTLYNWLKKQGVKIEKNEAFSKDIDKETLIQLYSVEKKTMAEIASILKTNQSYVSKYIHKYNIPKNKISVYKLQKKGKQE